MIKETSATHAGVPVFLLATQTTSKVSQRAGPIGPLYGPLLPVVFQIPFVLYGQMALVALLLGALKLNAWDRNCAKPCVFYWVFRLSPQTLVRLFAPFCTSRWPPEWPPLAGQPPRSLPDEPERSACSLSPQSVPTRRQLPLDRTFDVIPSHGNFSSYRTGVRIAQHLPCPESSEMLSASSGLRPCNRQVGRLRDRRNWNPETQSVCAFQRAVPMQSIYGFSFPNPGA